MDNSRALTLNVATAAILITCAALAACGNATPASPQHKADPMTTTDTATPAARHAAAGQQALDSGDFARASTEFDAAIDAIGDSYVDTKALDDTGMQLTLARSKANQGDLAGAAKVKAQVVRARLAQAAGRSR